MHSVNVARKARLAVACLLGATALTPLGAAAQTWLGTTGDYALGSNWAGGAAPGSTGTATFGATGTSTVSLAASSVGTFQFDSTAQAYTFSGGMTFSGGGIVSNSSTAQTFMNGTYNFQNSATASNATLSFTNAIVNFNDASGAQAAYINLKASFVYAHSGYLRDGKISLDNGSFIQLISASTGGTEFVTVDGGSTVLVTMGGSIGSIAGPGTLNIQNPVDVGGNNKSTSFSGTILAFSNRLTKVGTGTWTLSGANTITDQTVIAGGLINFSALANFGTGRVMLNGGGVQWAAGNTIDISPRLDPIGSGGGTFDTNGNNVALGTGISGGGGITKAGSGTLTLTGVNTYQGGTTINTGTISVAANDNLGSGALAFGSGTLQTTASFAMWRATTLNSGGTFDVASGTTLTHGGVIGGTGGLTKAGGGTLVLTAVNTYQGGTTINAGTLELSDSASIAASGLVDLAAAGASFDISPSTIDQTIQDLRGVAGSRVRLGDYSLTVGTANSTTFAGIVDAGPFGLGTGGLIKQGSGTLTLTGANTYTGGTTITGGLINFTTLGNFGTGNVTLDGGGVQWAAGNTIDISTRLSAIGSNGGTFDTNGNNVTLATAISGTGGITKVGNGTLTLSGINTYGGATAINGGTLALSGNGSIASSSGVNLAAAGATFDIAGSSGNQIIQDLSGGAGSIVTLGANSLTVGSMWNETTFDGVIGGTGGLIKQRYGTLILTGANTYTGGTTITGGTLKISADNNLGDASGTLTIGGTSRLMTTASFTISRSATLNGGLGAFDVATGTTLTYSGAIGGTGRLGKYGGGTMVLTNVSTYSGETLVEAGSLALSGAGSIAASSSLIMGGFGGIFDISQTTGGASISLLQSLGVIEAGVIKLGAKTLTVTTGGYFYGTIQDGGLGGGTGGGLSLASGASLTLYGTNTYSGATTIDGNATLELSGNGSLASSSGVHLAAAGATFNIAGSSGNQTVQDLGGVAGSVVALGTNSLTAGTSNSTNFGGVISGNGGFAKQGSGTLVFTGNNTYTGVTTVLAGTLQLGNGGTSGTVAGNVAIGSGAVLAFNRSDDIVFAGSISGDGAVSYRGPGLVTVTGTSSYTGGTAVTGGGGVQIGSDAALGATGSVLTLSDGAIQATARFSSTRAITLGPGGGIVDTNSFDVSLMGVIGGGGKLTKSGDGTLFLGGANTYGGGTTVSGGVLLGTTTSLQGNIVNDATVGFSQSTDGVYAGVISGSGNLLKTGTGTVTLTGANTYAGGTLVSGGVLLGTTTSLQGNIVNNASVGFAQGTDGVYAGNMSGTGGLTKTGTGRVMLTGTNTYTGGTLVSGGALFGTAESLQGNIVNNAAVGFDTTSNGTYAGSMSGSGVLAAFGAGTLILTGNNTYTGGTTILGGNTLQLGNGGSTGMIAGNVDIESGGVLAFNRSDNISFAGNIGGDGAVAFMGPGIVTLTGLNTYTGGTAITGGIVQANADSVFGTAGAMLTLAGGTIQATASFSIARPITLAGPGGTFDSNGNALTLAGAITGTDALVKVGAGSLILSGANDYSGGTTVSGGILQGTTTSLQGNITNNAAVVFNQSIGGIYAGSMSGTGSLTLSGPGNVTLTGANSYSGGTTVSGGTLTGTTTSLQGNITNNAAVVFNQSISGIYAGSMSGTGSLTLSGPGNVTLTGANSYSGGTTVSGGTLTGTTSSLQGNIVNNASVVFNQSANGTYAGNMSGSGNLTKTGAGNVTLTGTNSYTGGTTVSGGTLTGSTTSLQGDITNNAAVVFNQTSSGTYAGTMSGGGSLTKTGAGTLILAANNTYTGVTTISGGILQLGNGGTAGMIAGDVINNGVLAFNRSDNVVFAGNISGTGSIAYMGPGTVTLTGSSTYSGGTMISGGTVQAGSDSAFGAAGTTLTVVGGTIQATASFTIARSITLTTPGGTFDTNGNTLTLQGAISGTGGLTKTGVGTLILTGTNSYTGGTTVSAGILQGTTSSLGGNIVNNAAVVFDQSTNGTYGSVLSGTGSLTKAGSGDVTLTGTNSYTGGTTVSGGTLTGSTTNLQGNILNNAAVVFDQDTNGTYAGVLSGTGGLTKTGFGNVTLTGANSYSGGTTVSGGTLTGNTTSLQGNIVNNAAVVFNQVTDGTYAGIMSGTGGLTKSGAGNLTLSGANSYSGGTMVSGGTLTGATSSLQGNIVNNAAVVFTGGGTYAGNMTGTGSLNVSTTGLLILSGANAYTGGTTINSGTLQGNATSLQGNIVNNAALVFDQATTGTYAGAIAGTGSLTKVGAGQLVLTGNSVVGGGTTVSAGLLTVNGSLTGNVTVTNGGALGGSGTLIGALAVNGGTVAPGNSIGTMTVTGNFVQTGGVYQVEVSSAGQNDKIVATGTATINGGTVQVLAASGTYQRNTTYTIVSATGGLSGTYSGVNSNLAFLTPSLSYDANNVYLLLAETANAFAAGARTRDQYAVGTALDIASPTATGDFNTVLNALAALTAQQGAAALDAISGQPYAGFGSVNVGASLVFMNTLGQQIVAARGGGTATRVALAEACEIACDAADQPKWGAWISGLGGFGSIGGNANAGTLTYNLGGVAVGADYRFDPRFLVGVAFGYSSGRQWVSGFQGNGNSDNYSAALYASFNQGGLYVDALAGYAYSDNRLQRVMQIPGLATRYANGGTGANQFLGQIEAGYKIGVYEAAQATITPFARFQSVAVSQNAFGESGAQSLNLSVAQQNTTSLRTVIGADFGASVPVGLERPLAITLRLGWAHEYADTARPMTAAFAGAPTAAFTVYGAQPLRDAAVVGFGLNAQIGASTSLYARYDGEITGRDDSHAISAGLRMTW